MLGQASLPEGFHNEVYAIHQWLQLNFVHNAWLKVWLENILYEKRINSLAVPKCGSDLPPSVGRSVGALGNGSAIDAKVSRCPGVYRTQPT